VILLQTVTLRDISEATKEWNDKNWQEPAARNITGNNANENTETIEDIPK